MKHTHVFSACLTVAALAAGIGVAGIVTAPSAHADSTLWAGIAWSGSKYHRYWNYSNSPDLIMRMQADMGVDAGYQTIHSGECVVLVSYDGLNGGKRNKRVAGVGDDRDSATSAAIRKTWDQPHTVEAYQCQN